MMYDIDNALKHLLINIVQNFLKPSHLKNLVYFGILPF